MMNSEDVANKDQPAEQPPSESKVAKSQNHELRSTEPPTSSEASTNSTTIKTPDTKTTAANVAEESKSSIADNETPDNAADVGTTTDAPIEDKLQALPVPTSPPASDQEALIDNPESEPPLTNPGQAPNSKSPVSDSSAQADSRKSNPPQRVHFSEDVEKIDISNGKAIGQISSQRAQIIANEEIHCHKTLATKNEIYEKPAEAPMHTRQRATIRTTSILKDTSNLYLHPTYQIEENVPQYDQRNLGSRAKHHIKVCVARESPSIDPEYSPTVEYQGNLGSIANIEEENKKKVVGLLDELVQRSGKTCECWIVHVGEEKPSKWSAVLNIERYIEEEFGKKGFKTLTETLEPRGTLLEALMVAVEWIKIEIGLWKRMGKLKVAATSRNPRLRWKTRFGEVDKKCAALLIGDGKQSLVKGTCQVKALHCESRLKAVEALEEEWRKQIGGEKNVKLNSHSARWR